MVEEEYSYGSIHFQEAQQVNDVDAKLQDRFGELFKNIKELFMELVGLKFYPLDGTLI